MVVMKSYTFSPDRIYSLDENENGITTVLPTPRIIAESFKIKLTILYIRQISLLNNFWEKTNWLAVCRENVDN